MMYYNHKSKKLNYRKFSRISGSLRKIVNFSTTFLIQYYILNISEFHADCEFAGLMSIKQVIKIFY